MAANDAWLLQGMNGAVPLATGKTFTGLSRGVWSQSGAVLVVTFSTPAGGSATVTLTPTFETYIPGPITAITATTGPAVLYPESTSYTVV